MPQSRPAFLLCSVFLAGTAHGQGFNPEALTIITETARQICGEFQREGSSSGSSIGGAAEAKVKGLLGKLVDVGVEGAGEITSEEYVNVLREELGAEIQDNRRCNEKIWDDMKSMVVPTGLPSEPGSVPDPDAVSPNAETAPGNNANILHGTPANDIAGTWDYVGICPNPLGYGQLEITGSIAMEGISENQYIGMIVSNFGNIGEVSSTLYGQNIESQIIWSDNTYTAVSGTISPDGNTWVVNDSDGCVAEVYRSYN